MKGLTWAKVRSACSRRGAAVLVVLAVVVLLTVLIVSLLEMGSAAGVHARTQAATIRADMLRDSALNLVIAQLREATSQELEPGVPAPWASQAGAVHVHNMDGSVREVRKLYSAESPVASSPEELARDLVERWRTPAGRYADLNAPQSNGGDIRFPIADPRLAAGPPDGRVEGFAVLDGPVPEGTRADTNGTDARLPMPVMYMYFLADGTMGCLNAAGVFTRISGRGTPSHANPVVGRVAWWTDDESAKVNVNTAAEAAPWDTPRLTTRQDLALAVNQPMRGEFHRYPGHPATVCLSSVLFPGRAWHLPGDPRGGVFQVLTEDEAMAIWEAAPGLQWDPEITSVGGTRQPQGLDRPADQAVETPWHLYASPAEIALDRDRRIRQRLERHSSAVVRLSRADFLLTAHSRAPEISLFGTPRISMWPVHPNVVPGQPVEGAVQRASGFDSTMALVSSAGGQPYYLQRAFPGDGWKDFRTTAAGANRRLFESTLALLGRPVPGFARGGGASSFASKYGRGPDSDTANILALIFDYIRTTNLADSNLPEENQFSIVCPGNPVEGYGQISPLNTANGNSGERRWAEDQLNAARGLGRMPTISEAAFVFVCRARRLEDGTLIGEPSSTEAERALKPGGRELEAALMFEGFVPGQGWAESRPWCSIAVAGIVPGAPADFSRPLPEMEVAGVPLVARSFSFHERLRDRFAERNRVPAEWSGAGGHFGIRPLLGGIVMFEPVVVNNAGDVLAFSGTGDDGLKAGILDTPSIANPARRRLPAENLVQVIELHFPEVEDGGVPMPDVPENDGVAVALEERVRKAFEEGAPLFTDRDVIQSLVPAHGDARVLAGRRIIARDAAGRPEFLPHAGYGQVARAHSLLPEGAGLSDVPHRGYFSELAASDGSQPDFPWAGASGYGRRDGGLRGPAVPSITGDFDTAAGRMPDGPYINRADDGEVRGLASGRIPYFDPPPVDAWRIPPSSASASSPNRLLAGPGMFGSLPTGVVAGVPWQTLLFRPWLDGSDDPDGWTLSDHYGWSWPRDHLLLDLFWMPVIEPWAISMPFETAGKINLNAGIAPFRHIRRETALHALLKSERIIAVRDEDAAAVRLQQGFSEAVARHFIDPEATLDLWRSLGSQRGRLFLTASEVCELPLVPEGVSPSREAVAAWWRTRRITGENLKERPYANLHARLTARSNVFRVHILAETLQQARSADPGRWLEGRDRVTSRWMGSALVECHLRAGDFPADPEEPAVSSPGLLYSWRVSRVQQFDAD